MLDLLKALFFLLLDILIGMTVPLLLTVGGMLVIAALLRLATFKWWPRSLVTVMLIWLIKGTVGAFIYSALTYAAPSLEGALVLFLVILVAGVEPLLSPQLSLFVSLVWKLSSRLLSLLWALSSRVWTSLPEWPPPSPPTLSLMELIPPSNKWFRPRAVYAIWVYVWFTILVGWRYGGWGILFITLPAILVSVGGLFFISGFILPYPELAIEGASTPAGLVATLGEEIKTFFALMFRSENKDNRKKWLKQRRDALRCLLTYAIGTNYPYYAVIDEKINERTEGERAWLPWQDKLIKRLDGDAFGDFISGPGIVLTGCDQAVVLSTGLKFKGAKGPGVVFTQMSDSPTQVIDLRVQLRAFPVRARTKDGIAVKVFTFTPFRMGRGKDEPEPGKGFPYRTSDVFKAIQAQMVEHVSPSQMQEELKRHEWYDLPKVIGERAVREAVSQYDFDDLYAPFELHTDPSQHPRAKIGKALQEALERELPPLGLQRVGSGISNIEPEDPRVIEQRIEAWQANWKRKIMLQQAAGQSERLRLVGQSRAQAVVDVILGIVERLDQLRDDKEAVRMDVVARYFIEIIEGFAGASPLRRFLSRDNDQYNAVGAQGD